MPLVVRSLSTWLKIALVVLSVGLVLFIIGFSTNSWMVTSGRSLGRRGLWKWTSCDSRYRCRTGKYDSRTLPDFHKAGQAMECLGLIGLLLGFILLLLYCFVDSCRRREALQATIFFLFAAVVCMVIGITVLATKYEDYPYFLEVGWSMGVAIAGCVCTFVAGIFCVLHLVGR